ncbi:glycosyltransferase [Pseudovibrio exalbescens]|uniref:glycosyltransferase n=1 Tax=Pseudovibrio exalbescens TaxID=197461 RepID=UPI000C9A9B0B|nr:glycosyltransferase [Pseudovibrio exalbescens]
MLPTDILVIVFLVSQVLFLIAAYVFAFSGIDDLIVDALYYGGFAWRSGPWAGLRQQDLERAHPDASCRPLAIMLPAWDEAEIIYPAVSRMIRQLDYPAYDIFIGVYPNDPKTIASARRLEQEHSNVFVAVNPLDGPTCKADCLNTILAAIAQTAAAKELTYAGVIMQDAEDVMNAQALRIFNLALFDHDVIQLPVLSLRRSARLFTAGHYMDEFAEFHSKEVLVRQTLTGTVPGAGVGTCYSNRALKLAAAEGDVFSVQTLTEDYDFSMRLHSNNLGHHILWVRSQVAGVETPFAVTQEYFPSRFWASVRQKTRWTVGICFQGWALVGWNGTWLDRYFMWRDRKMIFFSHGIFVGYIAILLYAGLWLYQALYPFAYRLPPLVELDSPLWSVIWFNVLLFVHRVVQRHIFSGYHYGWRALPLVIPRYFTAILINYLAMVRATRQWRRHKRTGEPIGWDKTQHEFLDDPRAAKGGAP